MQEEEGTDTYQYTGPEVWLGQTMPLATGMHKGCFHDACQLPMMRIQEIIHVRLCIQKLGSLITTASQLNDVLIRTQRTVCLQMDWMEQESRQVMPLQYAGRPAYGCSNCRAGELCAAGQVPSTQEGSAFGYSQRISSVSMHGGRGW